MEAQLAEQSNKVMISSQNSVDKYVDTKLADFTKTQSQTLAEMETNLLKKVDEKLETKSDQLSVEVANYVTCRLLEVLNQAGITRPAGVTQDSPGTQLLSISGINKQSPGNFPSPQKLGGENLISQNLTSMSLNQSNNQRSPHDTNNERDTGIS